MQIRRVKSFDGGNHLVSDELQFRKFTGDKWQIVEVIEVAEAYLRDMEEGLISPEQFRKYGTEDIWREKLAARIKEKEG